MNALETDLSKRTGQLKRLVRCPAIYCQQSDGLNVSSIPTFANSPTEVMCIMTR